MISYKCLGEAGPDGFYSNTCWEHCMGGGASGRLNRLPHRDAFFSLAWLFKDLLFRVHAYLCVCVCLGVRVCLCTWPEEDVRGSGTDGCESQTQGLGTAVLCNSNKRFSPSTVCLCVILTYCGLHIAR